VGRSRRLDALTQCHGLTQRQRVAADRLPLDQRVPQRLTDGLT